ncbi:MAG: nicotinate phosphoribosyltransferase [Candidatus Melainabacteria bacterium]|nr:MAG: nicotinate phosphoribosyltransferase [Candidatus Melainabacteria bacterium]
MESDYLQPIYLIDFYKVGHIDQYPAGITQIWSNWTPRTTRIKDQRTVVHFGLQYFIKKILIEAFEEEFFKQSLDEVIKHYSAVMQATLGLQKPRTDHIAALHKLQYLPLDIYSIPEGNSTPLNSPSVVLTNTHPDFFWLPNYFETMLSAYLWKPSTSATTAQRFRALFEKYARESGETDFSFIDWQGHDFSMRGMSGIEDAILSGMGHLTCFSGTDSLPAILAANQYYDAGLSCGGSVPATEHSVMCAGGQDGEFETFRRLIEDIYPTGIVSIVSDTWDLWQVLTDYIPRLKQTILARNGKVVIRPDSGVPDLIICGNETAEGPARKGVIQLLAEALGTKPNTTSGGTALPLINNGGAIYGDAISYERADKILSGIVAKGLSPYNMVFGIGSYTYEYVTRDTYGFAMKATATRQNGQIIPIFKKPVTDTGGKFSHKGIPVVTGESGKYVVSEQSLPEDLDRCAFEKVFSDGKLLVDNSFSTIRSRVRADL